MDGVGSSYARFSPVTRGSWRVLVPTNYAVEYAEEYYYDGPRQRWAVRPVVPAVKASTRAITRQVTSRVVFANSLSNSQVMTPRVMPVAPRKKGLTKRPSCSFASRRLLYSLRVMLH